MSVWLILAALWAAPCGGVMYRLRGGVVKRDYGVGTHFARIVCWAMPTAALATLAFGLWPGAGLITCVALWLGLVLLGHGAHMGMDYAPWLEHRLKARSIGIEPHETEVVTFWLPWFFPKYHITTWPYFEWISYQLIGMTVIGVARAVISWAPLVYLGYWQGLWMIALGFTHGLWYYLGAQLPPMGRHLETDAERGEFLVGMTTWAAIVLLAS